MAANSLAAQADETRLQSQGGEPKAFFSPILHFTLLTFQRQEGVE